MNIEHPHKDEDPLLIIKFKDKDIEFYAVRLSSLVELRHQIDIGNYPLNWWKGTSQTEKDGTITELLPLNIRPIKEVTNPNTQVMILGLRWLVIDEVGLTAKWLKDHGYSNYADAVLRWDKERREEEGPPYQSLGQ